MGIVQSGQAGHAHTPDKQSFNDSNDDGEDTRFSEALRPQSEVTSPKPCTP